MKIKTILGVLIVLIAGLLLIPASGNALTVSPPIIELDANRGDIITQAIKVRNESQTNVTYYLTTERFVASGEGGAPEFKGEDVGLASWIKFGGVQSITIPAGETIELPFTVEVPNFASAGGQYAAIFLSNIPPEKDTKASGVSIASRVGIMVFVKIAGDIKEEAKVEEFSTSSSSYNSLPVNFIVKVNNLGNVHVRPMGTIVVKNMFGSVAGQVAVNENAGAVLPDQVRKFEASWVKNPNAVGATGFLGKYNQQKANYAFGKYSADLNLAYGTAGKVLNAKTNFTVIPWNVIIVNLIILIIIVIILFFLVKQYNAWLLKKYGIKATKPVKK